MRNAYYSPHGASSLAALFAITAGTVLVLLFLDLSRYIAVQAALQKAAQKAARCLAAVESPCVDIDAETEPALNWYGLPAGEVRTVYAKQADYRAEMPHVQYRAAFERYEVRTEQHRIAWSEEQLPVVRYVGLLNTWARLRADVQVLYASVDNGKVFRCTLPQQVEVPWGLDFDSPPVYLNERWCEGIGPEEAARAKGCEPLADSATRYQRHVDPNWGTSCALKLPGDGNLAGQPSGHQQPWLLLGGDPVCDNELPGLPAMNEAIPDSPPWGSSGIQQRDRPFPISVERQYLVVEAATCEPEKLLRFLQEHLVSTGNTKEELLTDLSRISRYFTTTDKITAPRFDPIEFNYHTASGNSLGLQSSFVLPWGSGSRLQVILPEVYDWTFFTWERFPNRDSQNPEAERTFLYRKICSWRRFEDAQAEGWTGLSAAPPPAQPFRFAGSDGSCGAITHTTPSPSYLCPERFSKPPSGPLSSCGGWGNIHSNLENEYQRQLDLLGQFNQRLGIEQLPEPADPAIFSVKPAAAWLSEPENVTWIESWSPEDSSGLRFPADYLRSLPAMEVRIEEPARIDEQWQPGSSHWLQALEQLAPAALGLPGWQELVEEIANGVSFERAMLPPKVFEHLNPFPEISGMSGGALASARQSQPSSQHYDYNADCIPDAECLQHNGILSKQELQQRVRRAVAEQYTEPKALDSRFQFSFSEQPSSDYALLARLPVEELPGFLQTLPACTPLLASCANEVLSETPRYIAQSNEMPDECRSGRYLDCFSQLPKEHLTATPREPSFKIQAAHAAARREMQRIVPNGKFEERCQDGGCSEIAISFTPSPENGDEVRVAVSHRLKLGFALAAILRETEVFLQAEAKERMELPAPYSGAE